MPEPLDAPDGGVSGPRAGAQPWDAALDAVRDLPVTERDIGGRAVPTVSARDLHQFLGSLDDFSHWFRDQVARCFLEAGSDYAELFGEKPENPRGGRPRREYVLTLHASRKVWMAAGTVRGNAVREYFAEQERRFLAGEAPIPGTAPVLPYSIAPSRLWDVPLSMADFLWLAGLSRQRARDLAAVNEVRLAEDLVRHRRAGEVGRHPITRQVLFLRGALDEWWAAFAAEVIAAAPPAGSR